MPYRVDIPQDKTQAEKVVNYIVKEGKAKRSPQAIRWWMCRHYMRGVRNFKNLNYQEGTLSISYMDEKGVLQFIYEDILARYQSQLGRLLGIDMSPVVTKEGISLDGMRKAGVGQVVLSSIFPKPKVDEISKELFAKLLMYGTVGLIPWAINEDSIGIEVTPPWEIIPIPIEVDSHLNIRGLCRRKMIPLEWVQELPGVPRQDAQVYKDMQTIDIPAGYMPMESKDKFSGSVVVGISDVTDYTHQTLDEAGQGAKSKKDRTHIKVVEAAEIWTMTDDNYWGDYILQVGGKQLLRTNHTGERKQFPPQVVSDIQIGNFWGRSYVDTMIPLNCELESAIAREFQNIRDWDLFGIIYEPTTSGVPANVFRGKDGLKRVRYEPDPVSPDHKPYNLQAGQTGLLPAKIVEMGTLLQDRIANQPTELMKGGAPGRVDSSSGLGFLFETSNVPLSPTAKDAARAMSKCYRVALDIVREKWGNDKVIDITHLDDTLAGIMIDRRTGGLKLTENAIPHPDSVVVSVASAIPRSKEQRKLELRDALINQIITPTEYRITARKEALDLPVGNEIEWQNYRRATLENLVLFGDGQTPGKIMYADHDLHPVHLMVLDAFRARPEFFLASPEVRTAFFNHRNEHMAGMGNLPEGMPYAEEGAEAAVNQMDMMQQGGGAPAGMI